MGGFVSVRRYLWVGVLTGCSVPSAESPTVGRAEDPGPRRAAWSAALPAAVFGDGAASNREVFDGVLVVRFSEPVDPASDSMDRAIRESAEVQSAMRGCRGAVARAREHRRVFREIFDAPPGVAACVLDHDLVVAAWRGPMSVEQFCFFVRNARAARARVRAANDALKRLPMHGQRSAQRRAASILAEAYLAAGNPVAAHRNFTLVTLLAPAPGAGRGDADAEIRSAWAHLARLEIARGNPREARECLTHLRGPLARRSGRASGAGPGRVVKGPYGEDKHVQLTEAMIARAEHRIDDAFSVLDAMRSDDARKEREKPDEADRILLEFGRLCHEAGRDPEARRAFQTCVQRFPRSRIAVDARMELRRMDRGRD